MKGDVDKIPDFSGVGDEWLGIVEKTRKELQKQFDELTRL
jgi:hypothetical protein